jgi:hypothetical protein
MQFRIFKKNIPTDLEILDAIYEQCYERFAAYDKSAPDRKSKIFVPFDLEGIAAQLNVDGDIIYGRLYYHLNEKFGYDNKRGTRVLVYVWIGDDGHSVNLPLVASILASLRQEKSKFWIATSIAVVSLIISIISFFS